MFLLCHIFPANPRTMVPKRKRTQGQWLAPAQPRQRQHSHNSSGWHFLPFPDRYMLFPSTAAVHQHTLMLAHPIPLPEKLNIRMEPVRFWGNATISLCLGENSP